MIYFFSDIHLQNEKTSWEQVFLNTLSKISKDARTERIVLVGDILHACSGEKPVWKKAYPQFFSILEASEAPFTYIEGNHDINMGALFSRLSTKHPVSCFKRNTSLTLAGNRIHIEHGDTIRLDDRGYRILRTMLRSPFARAFFKTAPMFLLQRIADLISKYRKVRTSAPQDRREIYTQCFQTYFQQKWSEGFKGVVLGHIHIYAFEQTPEGQFYANCGFWPKDLAYFAIQPEPWKIIPLKAL